MIEVDARGISCPIPVVNTQKAMQSDPSATIVVLLDAEVAKENVSRLARSKGYSIKSEESEDGFRLELTPSQK